MPTTLDSRMFSLNTTESGPGTACYFESSLLYAFPDSGHNMSVFIDDLSAFSQAHTPAALNHWRSTQLKLLFPSSGASALQTNMVPASVAFGGFYYLFWIDTSGNLRGMRSAPDLSNPVLIKFSGHAGKDQPELFTTFNFGQVNLSACVTPDGKSIAVQFLTAAAANTVGIATGTTLAVTFLFDPAKFSAFQNWTGLYNLVQLTGNNAIWGTGYVKGCFAWFTQADTAGNPTHYQVMTAFNPTSSAFKTKIWQVGAGLDKTDGADIWFTADTTSVREQPFILRDPDGAVRVYYSNASSNLETGLFLPNSVDDAPGLNAPLWSGLVQCANGSQAYSCDHGPTAVFVTLPLVTGNSPCPLPEPVTPPVSKTYKNCQLQRQMVILFSAQSNATIWYATRFYGTLIGVIDYVTSQPNPDFVQTMLLSMVADTFPYPPPSPTLWDDSSPSGMVDWTAATYEYLVGDQTATDVSYESNSAIGVKLGLDSSTGIALKADMSVADGTTVMLQQTRVVTRANGLDVSTKGIPNPDTDQPFLIAPQGALFGRSYPNLAQDIFVFADENNTLQINTAVPSTVRLRADTKAPPVAVGGQFTTYCYEPGALTTYEEPALDLTMKNKFEALSPAAQQDFVIDGRNYAEVYTNGKYLENIVKLFGAKCFGSTGDLSYLEYSFSLSGSQKAEYQDTSSFTEAGGTYLDISDYIGTAGGAGINIFGVGEEQSFYAEAGVDWHYSLTGGTTASSSWGLQLQGFLNPLASGEAYSVRMYFLRPSPLWAAEVKNFSGDNASVDFGSSRPVRILFTVPYISTTLTNRLTAS